MLDRLLSLSREVVIAHRGGSALRPENTVPAFDHAVALGADALECDVHLARDGELVVIHDAMLDRTTGAIGPVNERTAADLARVDAAFHFGAGDAYPFRGHGIGVPSLASVLDRYRAVPLVVELKGDRPEIADAAAGAIRAARATDRVVVGGFSDAVLSRFRRLAPEVKTGASMADAQRAMRRASAGLPPRAGAYDVFHLPLRLDERDTVRPGFVRAARRAGRPVHVWVVDERADMERLLDQGVAGLITDRPDVAVTVVANRRAPRLQ